MDLPLKGKKVDFFFFWNLVDFFFVDLQPSQVCFHCNIGKQLKKTTIFNEKMENKMIDFVRCFITFVGGLTGI